MELRKEQRSESRRELTLTERRWVPRTATRMAHRSRLFQVTAFQSEPQTATLKARQTVPRTDCGWASRKGFSKEPRLASRKALRKEQSMELRRDRRSESRMELALTERRWVPRTATRTVDRFRRL
jgi:hypothetical protein